MLDIEARAVLADMFLCVPARLNTVGMFVDIPKPTNKNPNTAVGM